MHNLFKTVIIPSLLLSTTLSANANVMLSDFGGTEGYGEIALQKNDDLSSNELELPFNIDFFGNVYSNFYVNNNGNVTFNSPLSDYIPNKFPVSKQPMIAPFWSDVDTSCLTCGDVYIGSPSEGVVAITWSNVAEYGNTSSDDRNSFQAVLIDRSDDTGVSGDFDVEFRYEQLEWTKDGEAQAGYDSGEAIIPNNNDCEINCIDEVTLVSTDQQDAEYYALPGSLTEDILELQHLSNTGEDGVWRFAIREGALPGETPENPIMPVVTPEGWAFEFNVDLNERVFIDPDVAVGYDYFVDSGDNFSSVVLPSGYDNDSFELWLTSNGGWNYVTDIMAGDNYNFGDFGVSEFRILGIDTDNMIVPTNTLGFVTGLTFSGNGTQQIRQVAITEFVEPVGVAEPTSILLMFGSLCLLFIRRKKS